MQFLIGSRGAARDKSGGLVLVHVNVDVDVNVIVRVKT